MAAQVRYATKARGGDGQCPERGDDRSQFADLAQVDVDAVDLTGAGEPEALVVQIDPTTHLGEQAAQVVARLSGVAGPAGDRDGAGRGHGGGEEGTGIGQVRLDATVESADGCGSQGPGRSVGIEVHAHAVLGEHVERHGDVGQARQLAAGVGEREPVVESGG